MSGEPDTEGTPEQSKIALRAEYRFGIVLILLLATFMVSASPYSGPSEQVVTVVLQGVTLLAALAASGVPRRMRRIALVAVIVSIIFSVVAIPWNGRGRVSSAGFVNMVLVAARPSRSPGRSGSVASSTRKPFSRRSVSTC